MPINVAKELMGHANISVTANIYTHKDQKVLHNNMAKLDPKGKRAAAPRPAPDRDPEPSRASDQ